jgi:hypothetical protein
MLAEITPINIPGMRPDNSLPGSGNYPDNSLPGGGVSVAPPIVLPPLPPTVKPPVGIWPPQLPTPGHPAQPIFIPDTPDNSLPPELPPGSVWPPLNPGDGIGGKVLALVWLVGVGYRWAVLQGPQIWPPVAQPK